MMNKPVVLSNSDWLLPAAVWQAKQPRRTQLAGERFSSVVASQDEGATWTWRGGADVPDRNCDEHMLVERHDGSLWMLVRTKYGIGQSYSRDQGYTWSTGHDSTIAGPDSRFFFRRLSSGNILLVNHLHFTGRSHLTASLSTDDGHTWSAHLLLDERDKVSYPDAVEAPDGTIYVIYDRQRYTTREILLARFREEDVMAGRVCSANGELRMLVDWAGDAELASSAAGQGSRS